MARETSDLKKRSGADLRALAEQRMQEQADPATVAKQHEASFLKHITTAKEHYDWIVDNEAWVQLGHETYTAWFVAKVQPLLAALGARPTPELANDIIDHVREDEADLPAAQRRTQQEVADLAGVNRKTVSRRYQDRPGAPEAHGTDLADSTVVDPVTLIPDATKAAIAAKTSGPAATSPAGGSGVNTPADPPTPPDVGGEAHNGGERADADVDQSEQDHRGSRPGVPPTSSSAEPDEGDGRDPEVPPPGGAPTGSDAQRQQGRSGVSDPAAVSDPDKVRRNEALTNWAQDTPEHRTASRRRQYFAFLEAGEKFIAAVGADELAGDLTDDEFGDAESFSHAFVTWLTAVDAIRKQNRRPRLVKGA